MASMIDENDPRVQEGYREAEELARASLSPLRIRVRWGVLLGWVVVVAIFLVIVALNVGITPKNATWRSVGNVALVLGWMAMPGLAQVAAEKRREGLSSLCTWLFIVPLVLALLRACVK